MRHAAALPVSLLLVVLACTPDLGPGDSLVTRTRVLAVRGEPAEVGAGSSAHFTLLVASPDGTVGAPDATWAVCTTPKRLGENDIVDPACVDGTGSQPLGAGPAVDATIPGDACALFGPDPPPGGYRPRDPDTTGGYYQPVSASLRGADVAFAMERISCDLANAPADLAHEYATTYTLNRNPSLLPLTASVDLGAVPAGARVTLHAAWTDDSAETYVWFDPSSQSLLARREALRVSWFTTAGALDAETTGRDEGDTADGTDDVWTAPTTAGTVHLWIVLRDSRGGVDFASSEARIVP